MINIVSIMTASITGVTYGIVNAMKTARVNRTKLMILSLAGKFKRTLALMAAWPPAKQK